MREGNRDGGVAYPAPSVVRIKRNRSPVADIPTYMDYEEGREAGTDYLIFSCLPAFPIELPFSLEFEER